MSAPSHTKAVFSTTDRRKVVRWAMGILKPMKPEAIAVIGQSGIIVGSLLSDKLNCSLAVVRKAGEPAVSRMGQDLTYVSSHERFERWVFIDDLIAGGSSYRRVREVLKDWEIITEPLAILLYGYYGDKNEIYHGTQVHWTNESIKWK